MRRLTILECISPDGGIQAPGGPVRTGAYA